MFPSVAAIESPLNSLAGLSMVSSSLVARRSIARAIAGSLPVGRDATWGAGGVRPRRKDYREAAAWSVTVGARGDDHRKIQQHQRHAGEREGIEALAEHERRGYRPRRR